MTHFIVEFIVLLLESAAFKANFSSYLSTCLNGRLLWVPYVDLMMNPRKDKSLEEEKG